MGFVLELFVLIIFFVCSSSLEWNSHSLLQLGSCPPSSGLMSSLDIHQLKGRWVVQHLPSPFPQCCRQPTLNIAEIPQHGNETQNTWIRMRLDLSTCHNQPEAWRKPLDLRLWHNNVNEATLLMELAWPLNAVGFATLNFVSADYKKYAVAYICHSFLLEHISIPFIIVRPQMNLEFPDWQRMKWSLVKQGISSAWTLTETKGQCNEVSDSETESSAEDLFYEDHSNSSEVLTLANSTESNYYGLTAHNIEGRYITNVASDKESKTTETSSIDPDAEWITTKYSNNPGPNRPEHHPPNLWPAILMEDGPDPSATRITPLVSPLLSAQVDIRKAD